MSTDLQHQKQNKSMFILLSIISILVIATLVVASIYFLKPTIEPLSQEPVETQMDNPFTQNNPNKTKNQSMENPAEVATTTDPQTKKHNKQDGCDVQFYENQLLVKNAERNKQ